MIKRLISLILILIMVITMTNFKTNANAIKTTIISATYEESALTNGYDNNISNTTASYLSADSNIEVFKGSALSGSKSLRIKNCDMRWWSLSIEEPEIYYNFKVQVDENFNNNLILDLYTQHLENTNADDTILSIVPDNNNAVLKDHKGNIVFTLEKNKVHKVSIKILRGKSEYSISIDDKEISKAEFFIPIYKITGMQLLVTNKNIDSYICFDDFSLITSGYDYPQMYSYQKPGKIPEIDLPVIAKNEYTSVYINNVKINLDAIPVEKNNTLYLPLFRIMECVGIDVTEKSNEVTVTNDKVKATISLKSSTLVVNNKTVNLHAPVIKIKGIYMAPLQYFNEVLNSKVWWDEKENTIVFTTGKYKKDNILRVINRKLYMNGEPYYEISFNKFDLCYQIAADYYKDNSYPTEEFTFEAAEKALKQLHELGFKSIRVFCTNSLKDNVLYSKEDKQRYFEIMDKMYDLCDKYEIQVVACLGLTDSMFVKKKFFDNVGFVNDGESLFDLITDKNSVSRQNLYSFLDEYISRYKDRRTILMWEIVNEGNLEADVGDTVKRLKYSLLQLSEFYADVTNKIHSIDSERLVTGGDSITRPAQWHLFKSTMEGSGSCDWTVDSTEDRLKALYLLHKGVDVLSTHTYNIGALSGYDTYYIGKDGEKVEFGYDYLMEEAKKLGMVLYNGETAGSVGANEGMDSSSPQYMEGRIKYLDQIVNSGVQLTHWWTFRSDRQGFNDGDTWRNDKGPFLDAIVKANKDLIQKYKINKADNSNTSLAWGDEFFTVIDEDNVKPGKQVKLTKTSFSFWIGFGVGILIIVAISGLVLYKKRYVKK